MNILNFLKQRKLGVLFTIAAVAIIVTAVSRLNNGEEIQVTNQPISVSLISADNYLTQNSVNLDSGIVESKTQTDLKAQMTAQIISVNAHLGDSVIAGQTIVKLQDRDIAAQLAQAQARLDELTKGARPQDIQISETAAKEAKTALINAIKDSWVKSDDAIHNHIDKFFINPQQSSAQFLIVTNINGAQITLHPNNSELAREIERKKYLTEGLLVEWQKNIEKISQNSNHTEIKSAVDLCKTNLQAIIDFANGMAPLVNSLSSDNSAYKQIIDGYKTEFSAARSTLSATLAALQGAQTAWLAATDALEYKIAGASAEQIRQAQASVDALAAAMAKTSIITPISGKISYISANTGELAAAGQLMSSIVNPNAIQVKTYVSENDLPRIAAGDTAEIDGGAFGIVTNVSPAIDSQNKKAQVIIAITQNASKPIIIGQTVSVKINIKNDTAKYLIPIQAIRFTGDGNYALSVDENQNVFYIPVETGELIGESVQIISGLLPETKILSSSRGLKEGDIVIISNSQ